MTKLEMTNDLFSTTVPKQLNLQVKLEMFYIMDVQSAGERHSRSDISIAVAPAVIASDVWKFARHC